MAVAKVSDATLGTILKIISQGGVTNNFSADHEMWDYILKIQESPEAKGRQLRKALRSTKGQGAVGALPVNNGAYKTGRQAAVSELIAEWKDFGATIEVDRTVVAKALKDFDSYGQPLVDEIDLKMISLARDLSRQALAEGTGVLAKALDAGAVLESGTNDRITFNVDTTNGAQGGLEWVEVGDILHQVNSDGTDAAPSVASGTYNYLLVDAVDRDANTITLAAYNSAGTQLSVTATGTTAGDFLVRGTTSDTHFQDLSSISTTDYNTLSIEIIGLEAHASNDGRKIDNITCSGNLMASQEDADGLPLDFSNFQKLLSTQMRRAGKMKYRYNQALMAYETYDAMVQANEVHRQLVSIRDEKRGFDRLGYQYGRQSVAFVQEEFMKRNRVYTIPDKGVLQFYGTEFDFVMPNGSDKFHLKPNSTGYDRSIQAFMEGSGALISVHNAAIGRIHNFTI